MSNPDKKTPAGKPKKAEPSPDDLIALLSPDTEKKVLRSALRSLPRSAAGTAIETLKALSVHEDPEVRSSSFHSAADYLKERGISFYIECLGHPNFRDKSQASYLIIRYGDASVVPVITKRLGQILRTRKGGVYCFHNGESELTRCLEFLHPHQDQKNVAKYFASLLEKWDMLDEREMWWITDQLEYFRPRHSPDFPMPCVEKILDGEHPIFAAAARGDLEETRKYLAGGVSVYASQSGNCLADIALESGNLELMRLLVEHGWNVERPLHGFRKFPLLVALEKGHAHIVDYILSQKIDLNRPEEYGITLFTLACCGSASADQLRKMLGLGANLHETRFRGQTPFSFAASAEAIHAMDVLAEAGADINAADNAGQTPLIHCAAGGKLRSVEWLIQHKANPTPRDRYREDALSCARRNNHAEIVSLLEAELAKVPATPTASPAIRSVPPGKPSTPPQAKNEPPIPDSRSQPPAPQKKPWWKIW